MTASDAPIEVDQIVLICNGCKGERLFYPNPPLVGAAAVDVWLKTKTTRCCCGAATCDARLRLKAAP